MIKINTYHNYIEQGKTKIDLYSFTITHQGNKLKVLANDTTEFLDTEIKLVTKQEPPYHKVSNRVKTLVTIWVTLPTLWLALVNINQWWASALGVSAVAGIITVADHILTTDIPTGRKP